MVTQSSIAAYEKLQKSGWLGNKQLDVLSFLFNHQNLPQFVAQGGIAREDIKAGLSDTKDSTVSRTSDLEKRGLAYKSGLTWNGNNYIQVWRAYPSFDPDDVAARVQKMRDDAKKKRDRVTNNKDGLADAITILTGVVDNTTAGDQYHDLVVAALESLKVIQL